jgi:hypothetical protein
LSFIFDLSAPFFGRSRRHKLELVESVILRFKRNQTVTIQAAEADFRILQDFFILLTDSEYNLSWPRVAITRTHRYTLYFRRTKNTASPPRFHECLTNFIRVKDDFGTLFSGWRAKREIFGSGFYLYLATRRGMQLYAEHEFVMLMWGIEAFHRIKYGSAASEKTVERIERILGEINDAKDKKWLIGRLKNSAEPNLEQRIFETLIAIPLDLNRKRLRKFAELCARYRNDLSHFGERRDKIHAYTGFISELSRMSAAIRYLYHALVLHEIGLSADILRWWFNESFYSFRIKFALAAANLADDPSRGSEEP